MGEERLLHAIRDNALEKAVRPVMVKGNLLADKELRRLLRGRFLYKGLSQG